MTMAAPTRLTDMDAGVIRKEHMIRRDSQPQRVWFSALAHNITDVHLRRGGLREG